MTTIELTHDEHELLGQLLEHALAALDLEIRRTDHAEFKTHLKERRKILGGVMEKLPAVTPQTA